MKVTDEQRSMIATAFITGFTAEHKHRSLCCAQDALQACARIVGTRKAKKLSEFFYESLACGGSDSALTDWEQLYLDKIAALETL